MKSILDPSFRYVNSQSTDLHKTFARIRRQMKTSRHVPGEPQPQGALVYPISRTRQAGM